MRRRLDIKEYVDGVLKQDRVILSKAITLIESELQDDQHLSGKLITTLLPHTGKSMRIGITGVPGVGKSTFIESIGEMLTKKGHRVAVLAIDPSSQRSKGSILGDKTRMETLSVNPHVFIRPTSAGKNLGGVAFKTRETILLCEAAGFDVILVETVGVGQSEMAVKNMTDFFLLLMLAGAGDELQGIKKGIIEMADLIAITKADGNNVGNAGNSANEYKNALHLSPAHKGGWTVDVKLCSAMEQTGISEIWDTISLFFTQMKENNRIETERQEQNAYWFHEMIRNKLVTDFYTHPSIASEIENSITRIKEGKVGIDVELNQLFYKYKH